MKKLLFILMFLLLIPIVKAATPISNCTSISSSGEYYLTQNITGSYPCISITASAVTLDLKGYSVSDTIYVNGYYTTANNVVVKNGTSNEVYVAYSNNSILQDLIITGDKIYIDNANPITVKNVEIIDGYLDCFCYGTLENIKVYHSDNYGIVYTALGYYPVGGKMTMKNIWIGNANTGMWIWSGMGDVLDMSDVTIDYTTTYGIEVFDASNSIFKNININYTEYGYKTPSEEWEVWYGALYFDYGENNTLINVKANPNIVGTAYFYNNYFLNCDAHFILFKGYTTYNNTWCGKGTSFCFDYPNYVDWTECSAYNNHFNDEACPTTPKCMPCDYTKLNMKEPSQYVMGGMCLFTNLLVCNLRLFIMVFILVLFVGIFLMLKGKIFG